MKALVIKQPGEAVAAQDTVALIGYGGVGLGAIAASHFSELVRIAVDVDDAKLNVAKKAGADYAVNTSNEAPHHRVLELTDGLGPDVIIEAIGLLQTFRAAVEEVAFAGRVVYIGYTKEPVTYDTRLFVKKDLDVMGSRNACRRTFDRSFRCWNSGCFRWKKR